MHNAVYELLTADFSMVDPHRMMRKYGPAEGFTHPLVHAWLVSVDITAICCNPCPVCGGYDQAERDSGERCHGFLSEDSRYVHCSREEHAGSLEANTSSGTYTHYLGGSGACKCGKTHGDSPNGKVVNLQRVAVALTHARQAYASG